MGFPDPESAQTGASHSMHITLGPENTNSHPLLFHTVTSQFRGPHYIAMSWVGVHHNAAIMKAFHIDYVHFHFRLAQPIWIIFIFIPVIKSY
jgi:hypothetical protein